MSDSATSDSAPGRYGARSLARTPGFTVVALITLALGIGANTAVLSLADTLFFRTPPARDPSTLVLISETRAGETGSFPLADADYPAYRAGAWTLSDLAAEYPGAPLHFVTADTSTEINGSVVTANYFPLLGLTPARGRFFRPDEDQVPDRDPVAVVSHAFWQRTLGGDPEILGRQLRLNGTAFTVIGVAPAGFEGVRRGARRASIRRRRCAGSDVTTRSSFEANQAEKSLAIGGKSHTLARKKSLLR